MNEQLYIAFENYLNNEMSQEERLEFESQLQNDADIREKFEIYKETTQFLSAKFDSDAVNFKKNLETISKENFTETNNQKSKVIAFKPWYYAVAATVAVTFGIWFMDSGNPVYGDFDQHEKAYFTERSTADKNRDEAQNAFNAKDYKKAVVSFEKIEDLTNPELQYFYAIALIETNHYKYAEIYLNNIKSGTSVYKDKAIWYLALSNLKQNKLNQCKAYLNQIPADAEDYAKAQKLLKDLD
jgi:predicted Zn-dependent protease